MKTLAESIFDTNVISKDVVIEEYNFEGFNSRFCDEFVPKLTEYILPQYRFKSFMKHFYFDIINQSKNGFTIVVKCGEYNHLNDPEVLRWEFLKNVD